MFNFYTNTVGTIRLTDGQMFGGQLLRSEKLTSAFTWKWQHSLVVYLQSIIFLPIHHLQKKRGDDIEPLTVAHPLVPARVSQQHPLQDGAVLIVLLSTEATTASSV